MGVITVDYLESYTYEGWRSDQYSSLWKIDETDNLLPPSERSRTPAKYVVMITRARPARLICLSSFTPMCACTIELLQRQPVQHADHASARCTYLIGRSIVFDSRSRESCRSGYPDGAICEQMDRQQHDPDQEQNPRNLDRHGGHSGQIQGAGNDSNHQEHQCVVQHIELLSIRRFRSIMESSMDTQFTYLTILSRLSQKLSTRLTQPSITRKAPLMATPYVLTVRPV